MAKIMEPAVAMRQQAKRYRNTAAYFAKRQALFDERTPDARKEAKRMLEQKHHQGAVLGWAWDPAQRGQGVR